MRIQKDYMKSAHLFESEEFDYQVAGAWLTGHDAAECIANNTSNQVVLLAPSQKFSAPRQTQMETCDW